MQAAALVQQVVEDLLVELPGTVFVGVGEGGTLGCSLYLQLFKLVQAGGQSPAYFPQGVGLVQLKKEHGDKLVPGGESLGSPFRSGIPYRPTKIIFVEISRIWPNMLLHLFMGGFLLGSLDCLC